MEVYVHLFITLTLDGGEWSVSRLGRFMAGGYYYSFLQCLNASPNYIIVFR
jgi:hypothetical protein